MAEPEPEPGERGHSRIAARRVKRSFAVRVVCPAGRAGPARPPVSKQPQRFRTACAQGGPGGVSLPHWCRPDDAVLLRSSTPGAARHSTSHLDLSTARSTKHGPSICVYHQLQMQIVIPHRRWMGMNRPEPALCYAILAAQVVMDAVSALEVVSCRVSWAMAHPKHAFSLASKSAFLRADFQRQTTAGWLRLGIKPAQASSLIVSPNAAWPA